MKIVIDTQNKQIVSAGHNSNVMTQKRIEFIRERFPQALTCNPYSNTALIGEIKHALKHSGLYKHTKASWFNTSDETIIRYVLKAQGKTVVSKLKKPKESPVYVGI